SLVGAQNPQSEMYIYTHLPPPSQVKILEVEDWDPTLGTWSRTSPTETGWVTTPNSLAANIRNGMPIRMTFDAIARPGDRFNGDKNLTNVKLSRIVHLNVNILDMFMMFQVTPWFPGSPIERKRLVNRRLTNAEHTNKFEDTEFRSGTNLTLDVSKWVFEPRDFRITSDASLGSHFLNLEYSQVLLANNKEAQPPTQTNIAVPILIIDRPRVTIHTATPESLFTNAEFPFTVEIISEDIDINDVKLEIIPPQDINFRGETLHTFTSIQKNVPISITSRIITPSQEINTQYNIPFQVIVTYTDDAGQENTDSKTVSLIMRPRTFMELTTDGGIWIGDFFIAPYVSLGTIIGIPAGAILSLAIRRKYYAVKPKKKRKKQSK
ncbi:hypothetical protein LCGC14_1832410, partial [marine sediment metagenome]